MGRRRYKGEEAEDAGVREEDAHGWIYRVKRYYIVNGMTDEESLTTVALYLEGKALAWYQWRDMRAPIISWVYFKDCLLEYF